MLAAPAAKGLGRFTLAALVIFASSAPPLAQDLPPLLCSGADPDWSVEVTGTSATLNYIRKSDLDIPHRTRAEGKDWPRALTMIGVRDTAILILHQRPCAQSEYEAQLLTQRGTTPVLLQGCCAAR